MRRGRGSERGAIVPFIVVVVTGLLMLIGLVVDGGHVLAARARALDDAQEAARVGAEQLSVDLAHTGQDISIDGSAATAAADRYLAAAGEHGAVSVRGDMVTVVVDRDVDAQVLGLAGLRTLHVTESGSARAQRTAAGGQP